MRGQRPSPRLPSLKFSNCETVVAENYEGVFFPAPFFLWGTSHGLSASDWRPMHLTDEQAAAGRAWHCWLHSLKPIPRPGSFPQERIRDVVRIFRLSAGRAAVARRRHVGAAAHVPLHCTGAVSPRRLCRGPTYSAASLGSHEEPRAFDPKIPDHADASRRLLAARHRSLSTSRRLTPGWPSVCLLRSQPPRTPRPRWLHTFVRIAMSRCMRCPAFLPTRPQSPSTLAPGRPNGSA